MPQTGIDLFGPQDGKYLSGTAGMLIGLHYYERILKTLGITGTSAADFGRLMMKDLPDPHPLAFEAWNQLW